MNKAELNEKLNTKCKHIWKQLIIHIWRGSYNINDIIKEEKFYFYCEKCLKTTSRKFNK